MDTALTIREEENRRALGGMRTPHLSCRRLPKTWDQGEAINKLLTKAQRLWPQLRHPAEAILQGKQAEEMPTIIVDKIRETIVKSLWNCKPRPQRTARARTPLRAEVIAGWANDPDSGILADWLDHGAPMGFAEEVTSTGVFPTVSKDMEEVEAEHIRRLHA